MFWTYATATDADRLQRQTGIPVVALKYGDMGDNRETLFDALRLMGNITNQKDKAESQINYINSLISDLNKRTEKIEEINNIYVGAISHRGTHGIGSTNPKYPPLKFINTLNVASEIDKDHALVSNEKIVEWNPKIMFIDQGGLEIAKNELSKNAFSSIKAMKEGNLYRLWPYN
ncbi:MAG: ABC transporter substrate-binding protein [Nanoarchaeota archaeon]